MDKQKIDIVVLWVDGNDPEWRKQKDFYVQQCRASKEKAYEASDQRFRDWDQLRYWFRGIEKNAPWVNKIHFVTWGHLPKWLNTAHPKLHIVKHEDIIPSEYLPVFSSHAIEIFINKIEGLSEQFIYFNDDMFLISPTEETHFFQNGLPCCEATLHTDIPYGMITHFYICVWLRNIHVINRNFVCSDVVRQHWKKFVNPVYGYQKNKNTLLFFPWRRRYFPLLLPCHSANPYLKSVFDDVWVKEEAELLNTCSHKFRSYDDVNQYVFLWWQICEGRFTPRNMDTVLSYRRAETDTEKICDEILHPKKPLLCITDDVDDYRAFMKKKELINKAFDQLFPEKCSFEK